MCGKVTFRKLLHMMEFQYGRVNALLVVLERPDIIIKRGEYRRKLKWVLPENQLFTPVVQEPTY